MFASVRHLSTLLIKEFKKTKPITNLKTMTVTRNDPLFKIRNNIRMSQELECSSREELRKSSPENIVWVDLEMTGLDPDQDHVLEAACLVTDSQLNIIAEGPDLTIHQPKEVLDNMNEWSMVQHSKSGLTNKCSTSDISLKDAEKQLLTFVRNWAPFKQCPMGGNTIYIDRMFLMKHMPEFEQHMHYRIIDVTSVKELCRRWYPDVYDEQPNKKELSKHRALYDIKATIEELKFYRGKIFRKAEVGEAMGMSWC